jgi:hypothetical protein
MSKRRKISHTDIVRKMKLLTVWAGGSLSGTSTTERLAVLWKLCVLCCDCESQLSRLPEPIIDVLVALGRR